MAAPKRSRRLELWRIHVEITFKIGPAEMAIPYYFRGLQ
jgi:hypothetical protein